MITEAMIEAGVAELKANHCLIGDMLIGNVAAKVYLAMSRASQPVALDSEAVQAILGDLQETRTNIIAAKGLSALTYLDEAIAALTAMKEDDRGEGMVDE